MVAETPITARNIIRVALLWAAEYALLSLIEDSPHYLKWATLIIPLAGLGVMQAENKLRNLHRDIFAYVVAALIIIYLIFPSFALYKYFYQEHVPSHSVTASTAIDHIAAPQVIRLLELVPVVRNKETGNPFFVNVFTMIDSDNSLTNVVMQDLILPTRNSLQTNHIDQNFTMLKAYVDAAPSEAEVEFPARTRRQISAAPTIFPDQELEAVKRGEEMLYVMVIWKYKLSDKTYYRELCMFYTGTLDNTKVCPGSHNGTYTDG